MIFWALRATPPGAAHALGLKLARWKVWGESLDAGGRELCGLRFRNPLGLAAGFDKDAESVWSWFRWGFGHVEVGTVTPRPQKRNEGRVLRRLKGGGLWNALGFPSAGMERVARRLEDVKSRVNMKDRGGVLGVNFGPNRKSVGDMRKVIGDYSALARRFSGLADYATVNVSSPNTEGLRDMDVGAVVRATRKAWGGAPLFVKLSPDMEEEELRRLVKEAKGAGADGFVATNTTTAHDFGRGGASGRGLHAKALEAVRLVKEEGGDVIGCGGVWGRAEVEAFEGAGASLVQLYTGFGYQGGAVVGRALYG